MKERIILKLKSGSIIKVVQKDTKKIKFRPAGKGILLVPEMSIVEIFIGYMPKKEG